MSAVLASNSYGKSSVRLTKVTRHADRHELKEISVDIQLHGDFDRSYTHGDNSSIVATDTMKNTVYALAKNHPLIDIESFAIHLGKHFLANNTHVTQADVRIAEDSWQRIEVGGKPHRHSFVSGGNEKRTTHAACGRDKTALNSGLENLLILKTTQSGFVGFLRDQFTTLPETTDRIFATSVSANWSYMGTSVDWNGCFKRIRNAMLDVFADHESLAVQQTLFAMGEAALKVSPEIYQIELTMPNQHRLLVNLKPLALDNPNEIFVPTNEPFGLISGTVKRK